MQLSILVTLYNCEPGLSETVKAILKSKANLSGSQLCIWNNGPVSIEVPHELINELSVKGIKSRFIETPQNAPLSWIYNDFIERFGSENNVILDHDSALSEAYISYVASCRSSFVGLPIIMSRGLPRSPLSNGKFSVGPYKKKECVISIGSGVMISRQAAVRLRIAYGDTFDERFALYGVDTSFFVRLHKLGLSDKLQSIPGFEHSLSRLEAEAEIIKEFRKTERSYDLGLMLRHYPRFGVFKILAKQFVLKMVNKNTLNIGDIYSVWISGIHKRCAPHQKKYFLEVLGKQDRYE